MNRGFLERINETTYYISTHLKEVHAENLRVIRQVWGFMAFLYVFMISFFYMLVGFSNVEVIYLSVPSVLFVFLLANTYIARKKPLLTVNRSRCYAILFYVCLYTAIIMTDAASRPQETAILFPMALAGLSAFYMDYILIASFWKDPEVVHADIPLCLGSYLISMFAYWLIQGMMADRGADNRILEEKSSTDLLTGLYNKLSFEEKANRFMEQREVGEGCALIIIDFDNFKHVNDEYGHLVGDQVLARCGKILRDCFRVQDIVGRVGGDEFMVLVTDLSENSNIEKHCDEVQHQLNVMKVGDAGQFSASIGIVEDSLGKGFKELYLLADDALYEAKARGKKQYVKWISKRVVPPTRMAVYIATTDRERAAFIKRTLGEDKYEFLESDTATVALNEISLYQNYLESVFFDYTMPDISKEILRKYINSRPLFSQIPVHDIRKEVDLKRDVLL